MVQGSPGDILKSCVHAALQHVFHVLHVQLSWQRCPYGYLSQYTTLSWTEAVSHHTKDMTKQTVLVANVQKTGLILGSVCIYLVLNLDLGESERIHLMD